MQVAIGSVKFDAQLVDDLQHKCGEVQSADASMKSTEPKPVLDTWWSITMRCAAPPNTPGEPLEPAQRRRVDRHGNRMPDHRVGIHEQLAAGQADHRRGYGRVPG